MDSLRIEAGHMLFMRELAALTEPFELGLGRLLDFYPPDFAALRPWSAAVAGAVPPAGWSAA